MNAWQRYNDYQALPEDVIAFAWSAPMRDLATQFGISDAGLRNIFKKYGIVLPRQGHWNRVHAGREVQAPPKPAPRRPGGSGRMRIDPRFKPFIAEAVNLPSSGPFASKEVPEDLEALRQVETKRIGRVTVERSLERHHPALRNLMGAEQKRRDKQAECNSSWGGPEFDDPVHARQLRLLNALFLTLAKRGHDASFYVDYRPLRFCSSVGIGDTWMDLKIGIVGKYRTAIRFGYQAPDPMLPASTPLFIGIDRPEEQRWQDDTGRRLESQIAEIAASLIVAGEAAFRRKLKDDEIRAEHLRLENLRREEEARLKRAEERTKFIREQNEKRVSDLRESGARLRQSQTLRELVSLVRQHLVAREDVTSQQMADWEEWALAEADKIDPILSGQILSHLHPPPIPDED